MIFENVQNRRHVGPPFAPVFPWFGMSCDVDSGTRDFRLDSSLLFFLCKFNLGCVRLGSIRNKNNWNNASKRLFGGYSHSGILGFPFRLFCPSEQNSQNIFRNIFLFRNIPNEHALSGLNGNCQTIRHLNCWVKILCACDFKSQDPLFLSTSAVP